MQIPRTWFQFSLRGLLVLTFVAALGALRLEQYMKTQPRKEPPAPERGDQTDAQILRDAIRGAYSVFRPYKLHDRIEGCPCCVADSAERELHERPLSELEGETFGSYVWKAMTTWGDVKDFKHFLPRILELLAFEPDALGLAAPEIAVGKLAYAKWSNWPDDEQTAVLRFLNAWWRNELHEISEHAYESRVDSCLCAIGQAVDDLSPFLDAWRGDDDPSACQNLARFIVHNVEGLLKKRRLTNAFWKERPLQMQSIVDWLLDPRIKESLEAAFFQTATASSAEELSSAVQQWEWIVNSLGIKRPF
ncbi:MAG TPA: hypothetical protein VMV10_28930 [Pirellulales bacterium]|nr:hypothetical protein [Pirellulales bacterium]